MPGLGRQLVEPVVLGFEVAQPLGVAGLHAGRTPGIAAGLHAGNLHAQGDQLLTQVLMQFSRHALALLRLEQAQRSSRMLALQFRGLASG